MNYTIMSIMFDNFVKQIYLMKFYFKILKKMHKILAEIQMVKFI